MRLNWKDTWATVLVIAAVAYYLAHLALRAQPFVGDVRVASAACFAFGVGAAVVGGWHRSVDELALRVGARFGTTASLFGVAALLTAYSWLLAVFVLNIVALWGFATLRHTGLVAGAPSDDTGRAGSPRP